MPEAITNLKIANTGWLYYKRYYRDVNFGEDSKNKDNERLMQAINATITAKEYKSGDDEHFVQLVENPIHHFYFVTTYPGLVTGTGYTHETGRLGETKIGFFFDHTTGQPCLPGHSVKGTLRSYFPQWHNKNVHNQEEKQGYILKLLTQYNINPEQRYKQYIEELEIENVPPYSPQLFMTMLENIIFEGKQPRISADKQWQQERGEWLYEPVSIYHRDIFYDASVVAGGKDDRLFGMDAITPHEHPLKNPIPLAFIKVLPNVYWKFRFNLKDSLLSPAQKLQLFFTLLETFGIGTKTNVGYGQFTGTGYTSEEAYQKAGMPVLLPLKGVKPPVFANRRTL